MKLWETLFAGCGKAAVTFPCPVNGVFHSKMGSYAHFHDVVLWCWQLVLQQHYRVESLFRSGCFGAFFCGAVCPKYWFRFSNLRFKDFNSFSQFL